MGITRQHLLCAWKVVECLGALAVVSWLMYPYPFTWDELGQKFPGAQYGVFIPALIYIWLSRRKQERVAVDDNSGKAPSNDPT